jgi:UDP-glucose 4-epimerase
MTARVLVTGGAGFIGHHLVRSLLEDGAEVLVVDDLSSGRRSHLQSTPRTGRLQLHEADVRQPDAFDLLPGFRPEIVYHLGAIHFIPYCNANRRRPSASTRSAPIDCSGACVGSTSER